MASVVSLLLSARSTAAAAFAQARAQSAALGREVARLGRAFAAQAQAAQRSRTALLAYAAAARIAQAAGRGFATVAPYAAIAAKITAVLALVGALSGAIGNLIPLIQLIAPAIATAGVAMLTLKLATNGFSDAVKAGLSGDTEAFEKALRKLSPSAADAARQLVKLRDAWKPLQVLVQEKLFHGVAGEFKGLSDALKPIAEKWLPLIAEAFARTRGAIAEGIANWARSGALDRVMANITSAIDSLLGAIKPIGRAFADVLEVASPSFAEVSDHIRDIAQRFADWIREAKENGDLKRWLDKAKETFGQVKDIIKEIGRIFAAIFKGSSDGDFLTNLKESLSNLADWLESDTGQSVIRFFGDIADALANVIVWIEKVVGFFKRGWDAFRSDTEGMRDTLVAAFGKVQAAFGAMAAVISGGAAAFGWIGGVIGRLGDLAGALSRVSGGGGGGGSQGFAKPLGGSGGGGRKFYASGGAASGIVTVGERGREIVDFNRNMVYSNNDQRTRQATGGTGGGGMSSGGAPVQVNGFYGSGIGHWFAMMANQAMIAGQLNWKVDRAGKVRAA